MNKSSRMNNQAENNDHSKRKIKEQAKDVREDNRKLKGWKDGDAMDYETKKNEGFVR